MAQTIIIKDGLSISHIMEGAHYHNQGVAEKNQKEKKKEKRHFSHKQLILVGAFTWSSLHCFF